MNDREIFELYAMGCEWIVQLHFEDYGFSDNGKYFPPDGSQNICINFRKMHSPDELISTLIDALFDSVIYKFCEEDDWGTKILANVTSQLFLNNKSRLAIDKMVTYFNRYSMFGEDYEKFDDNGVVQKYLLSGIEITRPSYWGFEIWIGSLEEDKFEFSRFGMTEEYILIMDPTKFNDGVEMAECLDQHIERSGTIKFKGLEDVESAYTYEQLKLRLKSTDYNNIRQHLIDGYDDLMSDFI